MSRYFADNIYYFVTVPTIDRYPFFDNPSKKELILEQINKVIATYELKEFDFGIISNHYHFISYFKRGDIIPNILKTINGTSAWALNKITKNIKPVWDEYYIYMVEEDVLLSKILGYVVGNPLRHKEVKSFKELEKYPFSSYSFLIKRLGKENVDEFIRSVIQMDEEEFLNSYFNKNRASNVPENLPD